MSLPPSARRKLEMVVRGAVPVLLATACAGVSASTVRTGYRRYADPHATVSSPRVDGSVTSGKVTVSPYWTADVISAATPVMSAPDVVSRATEYSETRHEAGAGVTVQTGRPGSVVGNYVISSEPDYTSHTVGFGLSREVLDRAATLGVSAQVGFDDVGRSDVPDFSRSLRTEIVGLQWSHVINRRLVLHALYDIERRDGYQANPYRWVPVFDTEMERPHYTFTERVPDSRTRHALEGMAVWGGERDWFLRGSYRFYFDGWGIESHTATAELWRPLFDDWLRLRLRARAYRQGAADFYRERYERLTGYRTGDYRLSEMATLGGGTRLEVRIPDLGGIETLVVAAAYDITAYRLYEYAERDSMLAHMFGFAIRIETR